eukprot:TRINITY_DN10570_c0_g1_i1.p1 TRINITY_DN10570_c0_g1~~TRINITY_DN10570_c0_g1_i1.p1  ORF type:complete len:427 (-),score=91.80 TRINITY_DN10570_c0_g1_i1:27-1307(-)
MPVRTRSQHHASLDLESEDDEFVQSEKADDSQDNEESSSEPQQKRCRVHAMQTPNLAHLARSRETQLKGNDLYKLENSQSVDWIPTMDRALRIAQVSTLKKLQLEGTNLLMDHDRFNHMVLHPSFEVAVLGSRGGSLYVYSYGKSHPADSFNLHNDLTIMTVFDERITGLKLDIADPCKVFGASADGNVKLFDLSTSQSEVMIQSLNQSNFVDVGVVCDGSCVVAIDSNGFIYFGDSRVPGSVESQQLTDKRLVSLLCSPVDSNYLFASSAHPMLAKWDRRLLKKDTPVESLQTPKLAKGLQCSKSGEYMIALCLDDHIYVFDEMDISVPSVKIQHPNQTGLWIADFEACFHSTWEDIFAVGHTRGKHSHSIGFYSCKTGKLVHKLTAPSLKSVTALTAWHPLHDHLVSVAYAQVSVWRQPTPSQV